MARRGEQRLAEALLDHAPVAGTLAHLLTGDARRSEALAHRALDDAAIRRRDLRRREALELYVVRRLVTLCPSHGRPPAEQTAEMEAGERAFLELPKRRRVAAALSLGLGLTDLGVAEVLRCSERTARGGSGRGRSGSGGGWWGRVRPRRNSCALPSSGEHRTPRPSCSCPRRCGVSA